jgi:tetratricopeptide (TPR) repeat protein
LDIGSDGDAEKKSGARTVSDQSNREDELVLDWDDAVDDWGKDISSTARAEAAPLLSEKDDEDVPSEIDTSHAEVAAATRSLSPLFSQRPTPRPSGMPSLPPVLSVPTDPAPAPSVPPPFKRSEQSARSSPQVSNDVTKQRTLYRPPSAEEVRALRAQSERAAPLTPPVPPRQEDFEDMDEDSSDETRIAAIPRELIESLSRLDTADRELRSVRLDEDEADGASAANISFEDSDVDSLGYSHDTDPSALAIHEGSGVYGPPSIRPNRNISSRPTLPPPDDFRPQGIGSAKATLPPPRDDDTLRGEERTRMLDISEVDFTEQQRALLAQARARTSSLPPASPASIPPPVPAQARERGVLQGLDELAPPSEATTQHKPKSLPPLSLGRDHGASTARNTVQARKPRTEHMPLVGTDDNAKRARIHLLSSLAQRNQGKKAAALWLQAGELSEELGNESEARESYERALKASEACSDAWFALSRMALARGAVDVHVQLLERGSQAEAPAHVRAQFLDMLARAKWLVQNDVKEGLRLASEAVRLDARDIGLLMSHARMAALVAPESADKAAKELAEYCSDQQLKAALLVTSATAQVARGELDAARNDYEAAHASDRSALDAALGLARLLTTKKDYAGARLILENAVQACDGIARTALERQAARLGGQDPSALDDAARAALAAGDPASLRTAARLAFRTEDAALKRSVVDAWVATTSEVEHALALLMLAELESEAGHVEACEQALSAAGRSAGDMALVHVVREVLARKRGDVNTLANSVAEDEDGTLGALAAAAKLAREPTMSEQERSWLSRAAKGESDHATALALLLDASAEAHDYAGIRTALTVRAQDGAVDLRVAAWLTLSDVERRQRELPARVEALKNAIALSPQSTTLSRALARATDDGDLRYRTFRKEAEGTRGIRAAFAQLRAGYALGDGDDRKLAAFVAAYDAAPTYLPTAWALHHEARRQGDLARLSELHGREAGRAQDPVEAVAHLVRAALIRASDDTDGAAAQLSRALDLFPTDPVLRELVLRLGDAVPATLRAEAIVRASEHAPSTLRRAGLLAAAGAFEDANQPSKARELYETVLRSEPADPIADMGFQRVNEALEDRSATHARLLKQTEQAQTPAAQHKALDELLTFGDTAVQVEEHARALHALVKTHPLALRVLERAAMARNDARALLRVEYDVLQCSHGKADRPARLRTFAVAQYLSDDHLSTPDRLDEHLLDTSVESTLNPWFARQLFDAAVQSRDAASLDRAEALMLSCTSDPSEVVSATITRCRSHAHASAEAVARELGEAAQKDPAHPLGAELHAEALIRAGASEQAAERFEDAARVSTSRQRAARLWYRAGRLWQEELRAPDRARDAFRAAAEHDVGYADVQLRLESLLSGHNDLAGLIALTETRLRNGGPPEQLVELHRSLAKLYEKQGDKGAARASLRDALSISPEHLAALRDYAQLAERDKEWREAAEALIRLARLSRDVNELRDVFFRLGEIYDLHMPDPRRAEAAYRRVLKLGPRHAKALERLAALYRREQQIPLAIEALERLVQVAETPARRREVAFELSRIKEDAGDLRGAEEALENVRRGAPTDLYVLRGLADFYRRQDSGPALAMHLNRAANDLSHALSSNLSEPALHSALVEVLDQRGRRDAASACASMAVALGLAEGSVSAHTDNEGNIPGVGGAAFSELLDDLIYPESLHPAVRIVFRHGAEALNKAVPFDVRGFGAEKLDRRHPLRSTAQELARWVGANEIEIYVTERSPNAFVPAQDAPVTLLVGRSILETLSRGEQQFLVARALKLAKAQMSLACRVRPDELALMLHSLIRASLPDFVPDGGDVALVEDMSRRIGKFLSKKAREELLPHLIELAGEPNLDLTKTYEVASQAANRAALLATGQAPAALSALHKLAGVSAQVRPNADTLTQVAEARELVLFALSEAHFEARQRAGADRR